MKVWIMERGEAGEGGTILGVYWTKEDARPDFEREYGEMPFAIDQAFQREDESIIVEAGCDRLTLTPHEVKGDVSPFARAIAGQQVGPGKSQSPLAANHWGRALRPAD